MEHHVLPEETDGRGRKKTSNMTCAMYGWLIDKKFATWRRNCFGGDGPVLLVQDHERCLWHESNLAALAAAGCLVVKQFPKCSPDLNAIEGWWHRLRQRMEETAPNALETRSQFLARLRLTTRWMNAHWRADALHLATNQKERARQVLDLHGQKCEW